MAIDRLHFQENVVKRVYLSMRDCKTIMIQSMIKNTLWFTLKTLTHLKSCENTEMKRENMKSYLHYNHLN